MTSRVPSSNSPQQPERAQRGTRPQASDGPPKLIAEKPEAEQLQTPEARLWSGQDYDKSLEIRASELESRLGEAAASERADQEENEAHGGALHESEDKKKQSAFKVFSWQRPGQQKQDPRSAMLRAQQQRQQATQGNTGKVPAFKAGPAQTTSSSARLSNTGNPQLTGVSSSRLQAVGGVQNRLAGELARTERPPDAFTLLKDAREQGVLFVEDSLRDGHREEDDDPEHAAAVEECIRLCFGLRGILRIGPGHNDKDEPIIVVATTHGFTDVSLASVPEKVHRFPTLIAIPFDLLPLKRER